MLTSKKQEWILKMIKGPDIIPVNNCPGHYTSKLAISITAEDQQVTIGPADVLDLSNAQFLLINKVEREYAIAWDRILSLDFEEMEGSFPSLQPHTPVTAHHIFSLPLRKKIV